MTEGFIKASGAEQDESFQQMGSRLQICTSNPLAEASRTLDSNPVLMAMPVNVIVEVARMRRMNSKFLPRKMLAKEISRTTSPIFAG
jgi:hypothetical protein